MKSWPVGTPDVYTSWLPIGSGVEPWLPCSRRSPNRRIINSKAAAGGISGSLLTGLRQPKRFGVVASVMLCKLSSAAVTAALA